MEELFTVPHVFVVIGLLLVLAELLIGIESGFDLVLIGSILILAGLAGVLTGSTVLALGIAAVLSVVYIALGRRYVKEKVTVISKQTNIDKLIGATALVVREITPERPGIVRLDDEEWRATSDEVLYARDAVTIRAIDGVTLIVDRLAK